MYTVKGLDQLLVNVELEEQGRNNVNDTMVFRTQLVATNSIK